MVLNDRLGKKVRVKCNEDDTVGDLKKLVAAQIGAFGAGLGCPGGQLAPLHRVFSPALPPERRPTFPPPPQKKPNTPPPNRHAAGEDPHPEVVHHLQGPHHAGRLRDPR